MFRTNFAVGLLVASMLGALTGGWGCSAKSDKQPADRGRVKTPDQTGNLDRWNRGLQQTRKHLQDGELDEAEKSLAELKQIEVELTEELAAAQAELEQKLKARGDDRPAPAPDLFDNAKTSPVELPPLDMELAKAFLERRRAARLGVEAAVAEMGSNDDQKLLAGRQQLLAEPDLAMPRLLEAIQGDDPVAVGNSLDALRRLGRPEKTLPAMIGLFAKSDAAESWPDVLTQIELTHSPGAGGPLLQLALLTPQQWKQNTDGAAAAELPKAQMAAMKALSRAADPPPQTLMDLLPLLLADGDALAVALSAARNAVVVHHQYDPASWQGLNTQLSNEQSEMLAKLPARLAEIMAREPKDEAAAAAKALAVTLRQIPAEPLTGVKVHACSAQQSDGPATAILDGNWQTNVPAQMWRHPASIAGTIVLDLGAERTVAAVRIWNLNDPEKPGRGWRAVSVYAGSEPAQPPEPVVTGVIPPAPGVATPHDYSITLPMDFVTARYVRLSADSLWQTDQFSGLSEVQVLGF